MTITKQMNIRNRTYYFYNDLIKLFDFDPNMLKLDKKNIQRHKYLLYWICYKKRRIQDQQCKSFVFTYLQNRWFY